MANNQLWSSAIGFTIMEQRKLRKFLLLHTGEREIATHSDVYRLAAPSVVVVDGYWFVGARPARVRARICIGRTRQNRIDGKGFAAR